MANIQKIFSNRSNFAFTYRKISEEFQCSELGHVHASFPFESLAKKMELKKSSLGRTNHQFQDSKCHPLRTVEEDGD